LVYMKLAGALSFLANRVLGLAFGAHEEHGLAAILSYHVRDSLERLAKHLLGFLQIDNIDAVALAENVFFHCRVPTAYLVAEVNTGLQQFFHRNGYQNVLLLVIGLCTRRDSRPRGQPT